MGNMGKDEITSPAGEQHTPQSSPSSSCDTRDPQDVASSAYRLVSPTRDDFIDGTPPVQIRQKLYSDRQAELEGEREHFLEKSNKSSPNSVDRWLRLLRDRDKLLRLSFCKENASILEDQTQHLENLCKSVERLALCPDPLVEQFCTTIGDVIKLCPLVIAHVRNPSLHDHMERGQSPLQPSAPSPQHSWVENERRMSSDFTKGKISPSNDESMGSPTYTPPKYSSTQDVGQAIDAFKVGTSIWSPLTPDESNNTNHIQSAENSLIGSYFALPGPNTSLQELSPPGSLLSVSNTISRQVTLATQTSPMLKSMESGELPVYKFTNLNRSFQMGNTPIYRDYDTPNIATKTSPMLKSNKSIDLTVYKSPNLNSCNHDSSINIMRNTDSNDPTLATKTTPKLKSIESGDLLMYNSANLNSSYNDSTLNMTSNTSSVYMDFDDPTLDTKASPMLKSIESGDLPLYKSTNINSSYHDSSINKMSNTSSPDTDHDDQNLVTHASPMLKSIASGDSPVYKSTDLNSNYHDSSINKISKTSSEYTASDAPNLATKTSPVLKSIESGDLPMYNSPNLNNSCHDSSVNNMSNISSAYIDYEDQTLSTNTSPILKSVLELPVYKSTNLNSSYQDTSLNKLSNTSSAYTNSDDQTLGRKDTYASKIKKRSKPDTFKSIFNNSNVNCLTLQTSPLLEFANTKDLTIFKSTDYTHMLNLADHKDKKWCKVKNRRHKKKKKVIALEDLNSGDENTPRQDKPSPPKKARINSEYDDEKVTRALVAAIQNLGQPSRYVLLEHVEPTLV